MSQPARTLSPCSPLPTARACAGGAAPAAPSGPDEGPCQPGVPPDAPRRFAPEATPTPDRERPLPRGLEPAPSPALPPASHGGPRVPVLVGRCAGGGWRYAVPGRSGAAGMADGTRGRPLPPATTLGELLAGRELSATGPADSVDSADIASSDRP